MFSINCLEITAPYQKYQENQHIYKNLVSDNDYKDSNGILNNQIAAKKRFFFNDYYKHNQNEILEKNTKSYLDPEFFYGKNINIQAIVGKNGSGKSSLMDLMYMAFNNFAFMFERGKDRLGAEQLYYIPDLFVNLYFSVEGSKNHDGEYVLACSDKKVDLQSYSRKESNLTKESIIKKIYQVDGFSLDEPAVVDEKDLLLIELVDYFFYTVASNYSIQSFISANYKYPLKEYKEGGAIENVSEECWINSIFHKNDGYIRPVVLNPYRDNGLIDCAKEIELSKDRLITLLIYSKQLDDIEDGKEKMEIFDPYSFADMKISLKKDFLRSKLKSIVRRICPDSPQKEELIKSFDLTYPNDFSVGSIIDTVVENSLSSAFHFDLPTNGMRRCAEVYILLKIIDIVNKYSNYSAYKETICLSINNGKVGISYNQSCLNDLFSKINLDQSHITKKIRRALNFLYLDVSWINDNALNEFNWDTYSIEIGKFYNLANGEKYLIGTTEYDYFEARNPFMPGSKKFVNPIGIDNSMPPSFFKYEIILKKKIVEENKKERYDEINYKELSSGELQLLQTLSVHAYHMENVLSISPNRKDRPRYKCVNLIFDEIELCFHPEYQRLFIQKLVRMIAAMRQNNHPNKSGFFINVMIVTHSPFVLSDIPLNKILFLEDGAQKEKRLNTFGGNVGEMLYDSFFMESTIGAFAEEKIKRVIKIKQGKNPDERNEDGSLKLLSEASGDKITELKNERDVVIKNIGDPVVRSLIEEVEVE